MKPDVSPIITHLSPFGAGGGTSLLTHVFTANWWLIPLMVVGLIGSVIFGGSRD